LAKLTNDFNSLIAMLSNQLGWLARGGLIVASAVLYAVTFRASDSLSQQFAFSHSTSWVFLPAGVRMLLALILMELGAVGVALGTAWIDYEWHDSLDHFYNCVTAMIAGGSVYLSTLISQKLFRLQSDLARLDVSKLLGISAVCSIVSSLMHQTWYVWQGKTEHFLPSLAMMAIGDFLGTLIVLGLIQTLLRWIKSPA
jgi:hypothetical protein